MEQVKVDNLAALYQHDYYGWVMENVALLRQGKVNEVDINNIAEELEDMGKSEKRALNSRLAILIAHLLKWQYQPTLQSKSWSLTIKEQRKAVAKLMSENPSLTNQDCFNEFLNEAYEDAIIKAAKETGLDENTFPAKSPYNQQQILDNTFYPN